MHLNLCRHPVRGAGCQRHRGGMRVRGFNAEHRRPFVVPEIRHGSRFRHPRIPKHCRPGPGFSNPDSAPDIGYLAGGLGFEINPVRLGRDRDGGCALLFPGEPIRLVKEHGVLQARDAHSADIRHLEVRVQRLLKLKGVRSRVGHGKCEPEFPANNHFKLHNERMRPERQRLRTRNKPEPERHALRRLGGFHQFPWKIPRKPVHRGFWVVLTGTEPRKNQRDAAPDGFALGEKAFAAQKKDRLGTCGLEMGEMRALKIEVGFRHRMTDLDAGKTAVPGDNLDGVRERRVGHGAKVREYAEAAIRPALKWSGVRNGPFPTSRPASGRRSQ